MKYVLVSGGGMSGIGKGIIASSTGLLLKSMGLKVTAIKIDPYLNIGELALWIALAIYLPSSQMRAL